MTNDGTGPTDSAMPSVAEWKKVVACYEQPSTARAAWQLVDTLVPYIGLWVLMYWSRSVSWWLTALLAALAGTLLLRVFIIFHDCGHGSFLKFSKANAVVGFIAGLMTFTPFYHWRWQHALHHSTSGDLDRRGLGDVWTLTVQEYFESSPGRRFAYRLSRNPVALFVLAPAFLFVVGQRIPSKTASPRERRSVWWMNLGVLCMAVALSLVYGVGPYLFIQLIAMSVAGTAGVWLFYVQHQFEGVYWERGADWDYTAAALQGSSFYKLPPVLRWLSGNIGYHHIHHLSSRIPNYNLKRCHDSSPIFRHVKPLTLIPSLKSMTLGLWDEKGGKLVSVAGFGKRKRADQDRADAWVEGLRRPPEDREPASTEPSPRADEAPRR